MASAVIVEMKQEVRRLSSVYLDGTPMYPGEWLLTWLRLGTVWHLVSIEPTVK